METVIGLFGGTIPADRRQDIMNSAVMRCLEKHDEAYGRRFLLSLYRFTTWECSRFVRDTRRQGRPLRLSELPELSDPAQDRRDDLIDVHDCMQRLAEDDRAIIDQRYLMCMTYQEIGDIHGYSYQTAMVRVRRAIERLRRLCLKDSA